MDVETRFAYQTLTFYNQVVLLYFGFQMYHQKLVAGHYDIQHEENQYILR